MINGTLAANDQKSAEVVGSRAAVDYYTADEEVSGTYQTLAVYKIMDKGGSILTNYGGLDHYDPQNVDTMREDTKMATAWSNTVQHMTFSSNTTMETLTHAVQSTPAITIEAPIINTVDNTNIVC